jgi:hypothetical protein
VKQKIGLDGYKLATDTRNIFPPHKPGSSSMAIIFASVIIPTELPQAIIANLPAQQCLQDGDIILAQVGAAWRAQVLAQPLARTVCAAPLLVLRVHDATRLHPQWLCCYLHTNRVQRELCRYHDPADAHEGALSCLHGLRLPVPTPAKQHNLCQLAVQFASIAQQTLATLNLQRQNNEALWLALAHEAPEQNPA